MDMLLIVEGMILSALVFAYGFKVLISVLVDGRDTFTDAIVIAFSWFGLMLVALLSFIFGISKIFA